ncbi:growth arrest and DNA damage-inducible protein GADD45 alpha [Biomphalaria glabrata]|uniref:Growth arrest and DNA damage-inducible protein GADD45 alpha-like n=1 Tax=Biomphalaria glabrata TaxID=6526 RepID=A0A2C9L175_BIOGL|nr:growth arrest and DNA damage-inducible protein GADD45 alpha-like [Biomphalaria glabrata]KAI8750212.1 growth arrest and DNA damage-inducible protein GADD45 alpha-like [Biomphalaria glabrata]
MTLPDTMDKENTTETRKLKVMGLTLRACIKQALRRHGLTCGMKACGELLHSAPSTVMMCLLPDSRHNVSVHINQTLIEAFCRENNILTIHVKDDSKLQMLLHKLSDGRHGSRINGKSDDSSCLLIQVPKRGPSKEDQLLCQYFEEMLKQTYPLPHLTLPD